MRRLRQVEEAAELVDGQIWATVTKTPILAGVRRYRRSDETVRRELRIRQAEENRAGING